MEQLIEDAANSPIMAFGLILMFAMVPIGALIACKLHALLRRIEIEFEDGAAADADPCVLPTHPAPQLTQSPNEKP